MSHKNNNNQYLLDICILTAGRVDLFRKCVEAILLQMGDEYCIHVFNNGSPSAEYEEVYKTLPLSSQIKRTNTNIGFGGGANSVIRMGRAPLVLFISDDIFIHPGAIETLIRRMDDPTIGLCGYKFLFPEDSTDPTKPAGKVQHVGHAMNIRGDVIHPLIGWSSDNPRCNISRECLSVTGASFIVRRQAFQKAGGFNAIYGKGYFEDVDLCLTLRMLGYKIYIDTGAVATHGVAETFKVRQNDPPPNLAQNQMIFRARHAQNLIWNDYEWY